MEAPATLVLCGASASLPGWAEACAQRSLALRAVEGAEALPDRDAGVRLEQELEQVSSGLRVLVGAGGGGTRAFLHACRSRRVDAVILVDAPLVLADLSQDMPVQPLEMSLNLEAPVLVLDRDGTDERAAIGARLDPFAKPWDADRALGGEADVLRVARFLEEFLDLDLA